MQNNRIFTACSPLILASTSPRRISFMHDIGLTVQTVSPPLRAEPLPLPNESPAAYAVRVATAKALSLLPDIFSRPVPTPPEIPLQNITPATDFPVGEPVIIAADTIVALGSQIFGKPDSPEHAFRMLRQLAGKTHEVITGCTVVSAFAISSFAVRSHVTMWQCSDALLANYAASEEPADKAGAYAVQGAGSFLVEKIEGSWTNVVGLPLAEMVQHLQAIGAIVPSNANAILTT